MHDLGEFTRTAAAMVTRNDRRAWVRALKARLIGAAQVAGLGWSALAVAGIVLWLLPMNMRAA